jgi:hypothetical protein
VRRAVVVAAAAAVLLWLIAAAWLVLSARSALHAGVEDARAMREASSAAAIADGRLLAPTRSAKAHFDAAARRLSSPLLRPFDAVPIVGRHLVEVRRLSRSARTVVHVGERALVDARHALDRPHATGSERLAVLEEVRATVRRTDVALRGVATCGRGPFVSSLAHACNEFADELGHVRDGIATARAGADAAVSLLTGPRHYLVIAGNNAEMRAGSGMPLQVGVLDVANGVFDLRDMSPVWEHAVPAGAVSLPTDLERDWGWTHPTTEWRNLMATPAFDRWAPLAADMWAASGNDRVDGVLLLDPVAVSLILKATGPVDVAGSTIGSDAVIPLLLHDQYAQFNDRNDERRDLLAAIASATFDVVADGRWSFADLLDALSSAAADRHLLLWSRHTEETTGWRRLHVDGSLGRDEMSVALLNRGSNKLDWFVGVEAHATSIRSGAKRQVTLQVTVRNKVGRGEAAYIAGPQAALGLPYGTYRGLVEVVLPPDVTVARAEGGPPLAVAGREQGFLVLAQPFELAPGAVQTFTFRGEMDGGSTLRIAPSARVPDVSWTVGSGVRR